MNSSLLKFNSYLLYLIPASLVTGPFFPDLFVVISGIIFIYLAIKNKEYGYLYIQAITEVPISLTKEQKNLLEEFRKLEDNKTNPTIRNFFEKAKKFWKN